MLMRAALLERYRDPDFVRIGTCEKPVPQDGHLLVAVKAAAINPLDWKICDGLLADLMPLAMPVPLGSDIAGIVVEAPAGSGMRVGDDVFAKLDLVGAFAEFASVPQGYAARMPEGIDYRHAAAIPLAALTAWQALEIGGIVPGKSVLIHGAGGGVGGFATQIAKALGAYVTAVCSAEKRDHVLGLGADEVIDYRAGPFERSARDVDIALDLVGEDLAERSVATLGPDGVVVTVAAAPGVPLPDRIRPVFVRSDGAQLGAIAHFVRDGLLRPHIEAVYPLDAAQRALAHVRAGHGRGKIVLAI